MKICTKCGQSKPLDKFNKDVSRQDGLYPQCKKCRKAARDPDKIKSCELKRSYGLTLDQYNTMIRVQNNQCQICRRHFSNERVVACVDHCHTTGEIRGLLCRSCNTMLGQAGDDPQILLEGINYLLSFKKEG